MDIQDNQTENEGLATLSLNTFKRMRTAEMVEALENAGSVTVDIGGRKMIARLENPEAAREQAAVSIADLLMIQMDRSMEASFSIRSKELAAELDRKVENTVRVLNDKANSTIGRVREDLTKLVSDVQTRLLAAIDMSRDELGEARLASLRETEARVRQTIAEAAQSLAASASMTSGLKAGNAQNRPEAVEAVEAVEVVEAVAAVAVTAVATQAPAEVVTEKEDRSFPLDDEPEVASEEGFTSLGDVVGMIIPTADRTNPWLGPKNVLSANEEGFTSLGDDPKRDGTLTEAEGPESAETGPEGETETDAGFTFMNFDDEPPLVLNDEQRVDSRPETKSDPARLADEEDDNGGFTFSLK